LIDADKFFSSVLILCCDPAECNLRAAFRKTGIEGRKGLCQTAGREENRRKTPQLTMNMKPNPDWTTFFITRTLKLGAVDAN
jgi:hypothetical protein